MSPLPRCRALLLLTLAVLLVPATRANSDADAGAPDAAIAPPIAAPIAQSIAQSIALEEYRFAVEGENRAAPNRAHGFSTVVDADGFTVTSRADGEGAFRFSIRLAGFTRGGASAPVVAGRPGGDASRATLERDGATEWFVNAPEGLEHGLTIDRAPLPGAGDPLRLEFGFEGTLHPRLGSLTDLALEDFRARTTLWYRDLRVDDAAGREIPARFRLAPGTIVIEIDDRDAAYPLTVDPLLATEAWSQTGTQNAAQVGFAVGTAGDVNDDGFSDIYVSAPFYDIGSSLNCGRVFIYHGSANGPVTPAAQTLSGGAGDEFGYAVSTAGDTNDDGFADLIVGAPGADDGASNGGIAKVYLGSATGLPATSAWTRFGLNANGRYGHSVGFLKITSDPYFDVAIGAPYYDSNGETDNGRVEVFEGGPTGPKTVALATYNGCCDASRLGISVAGAGDVDANGWGDLVMGNTGRTSCNSGQTDCTGSGFLVAYGISTGLTSASVREVGTWTSGGGADSWQGGYSVAGAGDVNGDGFADVIVGGPFYGDAGGTNKGRAWLFAGGSGALAQTPFWNVTGTTDDQLGKKVGTAGDVNGDGVADVFVGAPEYATAFPFEAGGRMLVYYGGRSSVPTSASWLRTGAVDSGLGQGGGCAGDVNGDGYGDFLVGAPLHDERGNVNSGRAALFYGSPDGLDDEASTFGLFVQSGSKTGSALALNGDIDADGLHDLLVGKPLYDAGQTDEGYACVYLGKGYGLFGFATRCFEGNQAGAQFGSKVQWLGDVNGDGYDDLAVGAPYWDSTGTDRGAVFVWFGPESTIPSPGTPANADHVFYGRAAGADFGAAIAGGFDVNGDGYTDMAVNDGDRITLFRGSSAGLRVDPSWAFVVPAGGSSSFGDTLVAAGDVNGDGFGDLLVGDYGFGAYPENGGAAWLFLGGVDGLGASPAWHVQETQSLARFGYSMTALGDVDGDGRSDFAVGAYLYDEPGGAGSVGRVDVFLGTAGGASTSPSQVLKNLGTFRYGETLAAGDVNGDGYSDLAVGSQFAESTLTDEGLVWVHYGSAAGLSPATSPTLSGATANRQLGGALAGFGDVNGDGFADLAVTSQLGTATGQDGDVDIFLGGGGGGLPRTRRQLRFDEAAPLGLLGMGDEGAFFTATMVGHSPGGRRAQIGLEVQENYFGSDYSDFWFLTKSPPRFPNFPAPYAGVNGAFVLDLEVKPQLRENDLILWRARTYTEDPFFPRSPWLYLAGNSGLELDHRQQGAYVPGKVTGLTLAKSGTTATLAWSVTLHAKYYDVVRGTLSALLPAGDLAASVDACLDSNETTTATTDPAVPAAGDGFWYLVRAESPAGRGTYDEAGGGQQGSRDPGIGASPNRCP